MMIMKINEDHDSDDLDIVVDDDEDDGEEVEESNNKPLQYATTWI